MGLLDFNTFNFENIKLKTQLGTFHLDQSANSPGTARIHCTSRSTHPLASPSLLKDVSNYCHLPSTAH